MNELDQAHEDLLDLAKKRLKINPGLESVLAHPRVVTMEDNFNSEMRIQVYQLLRSGVWKDIDRAIGKAEQRVYSESDLLEIQDAVVKNQKPIEDKLGEAFADFLILIFNLGGQDFLNRTNIPATFNLTNQQIISAVQQGAKLKLAGIDETTAKWVSDQIFAGKKLGYSNAQIADAIRDVVPDTYDGRAERIVRTETSKMVGESEHVTARNNGASHKEWVTVSDGAVCDICEENEMAGQIGVSETFPSGDPYEPAHPNCRCLVEYVFTPFMGSIWHGQ